MTSHSPEYGIHPADSVNIGDGERCLLAFGGALLLLRGLGSRGWSGLTMALMGGGLLSMSMTGRNPLYRAMGLERVRAVDGHQRLEVRHSITIQRPVEELFEFWRHFDNLPRIMPHVDDVRVSGDKRARWKSGALEWETVVVNEQENRLIAWESQLEDRGVVRFSPAPGDRGTEVTIEMEYVPLGGSFGTAMAKLFGREPAAQVQETLHRFKQLMECGEFATTNRQPRGGADARR